MLFIDFHMLLVSSLCVILHVIEVTYQMHKNNVNNLVYVSLVTNTNKSLKMLFDTNLT